MKRWLWNALGLEDLRQSIARLRHRVEAAADELDDLWTADSPELPLGAEIPGDGKLADRPNRNGRQLRPRRVGT